MAENLISRDEAERDILACAAFLGERIRSNDGRAEAMGAVVPRYLARGETDLSAELSDTVEDPYSRDKLLTQVAEKCAELEDVESGYAHRPGWGSTLPPLAGEVSPMPSAARRATMGGVAKGA